MHKLIGVPRTFGRDLGIFLAKNRYYVITTFKMLKMEFKFEYAILTKKV